MIPIEIAHFLPEGRDEAKMILETLAQRTPSAALTSDDEEVRQGSLRVDPVSKPEQRLRDRLGTTSRGKGRSKRGGDPHGLPRLLRRHRRNRFPIA